LSTNNGYIGLWKGNFRARYVSGVSGVRVLNMSKDSAGDVNARDFSGSEFFFLNLVRK